ncbi:neutral zinc metallopeptidase [Amycolatopsis sp. cg5]|uniref:neutral zinc metallopeptidase n=1 Tax=Amycolatopsis sp. cg5 TaxID=3238802 RepID=UPI003523B90C
MNLSGNDPAEGARPEPPPVVAEVPRSTYAPLVSDDYLAWAPPAYPQPKRGLKTGSRVIIGLFAAALVFVAGAVVVDASRTVSGHALPAPNAESELAKSKAGEKPGAKVAKVLETDKNPILGEGISLTKVTCTLPQISKNDAELLAFYKAALVCLEEAWKPVLDQVNEPHMNVNLEIELPASSRCGEAPDSKKAMAYYCPGDLTIYLPREWMLSAVGTNKGAHLATLAHEYGHHVQHESGMLAAISDQMESKDESSPGDQQRVRRIELQANCFGALFIAAAAGRGGISAATANSAVADYGNTANSETHGSRANQGKWAQRGYSEKTTASCNTWSASAGEVS